MIKILEHKKVDKILYTCEQGDSLEGIAAMFGTSVQAIKDSNPLFSRVYSGCVLLLECVGKKRITVEPLQTLAMIACAHKTTVENLMRLNNLVTERVFVGMQLLVEEE